MSRRTEYTQITFERGIVETFKQDDLDQQNALSSCLYMSNWNPNLETKSIVRRYPTMLSTFSPVNPITHTKLNGHIKGLIVAYHSVADEGDSATNGKILFVIDNDNQVYSYFRKQIDDNTYLDRDYWNAFANAISPGYQGIQLGDDRDISDWAKYGEALYLLVRDSVAGTFNGTVVYKHSFKDYIKYLEEANLLSPLTITPPLANDGRVFNIMDGVSYVKRNFGVVELASTQVNMSNGYDDKVLNKPALTSNNIMSIQSNLINLLLWEEEQVPTYPNKIAEGYGIYQKIKAISITSEIPNFSSLVAPLDTIGVYRKTGTLLSMLKNIYDNNSNRFRKVLLSDIRLAEGDGANGMSVQKITAFSFVNYIQSKIPRTWFNTEVIPIVITAIIEDNEYVIGETNYIVKNKTISFDTRKMANIEHVSMKIGGARSYLFNTIEPVLSGFPATPPYTTNFKTVNLCPGERDATGYTFYDIDAGTHSINSFGNIKSEFYLGKQNYLLKSLSYNENGSDNSTTYAMGLNSEALEYSVNYDDRDDVGGRIGNFCNMISYMRHNAVKFNLLINQSIIHNLIGNKVTSFKVYAARPDTTRDGILRSMGSTGQETPPTLYSFPRDTTVLGKTDYSQYALLKEFRLTGEPTDIADYIDYDKRYFSQNAWRRLKFRVTPFDPQFDPYDLDYYMGSYVPDKVGDIPAPSNSVQIDVTTDQNADAIIKILTTPLVGLDTLGHSSLLNEGEINYGSGSIQENMFRLLTPIDCCVWDYPSDSPSLSLGFSGQSWQGKSAGLIEVSNGVVYIGQTYDENGIEEVGAVRFCLIQNGKAVYNIFPKENIITFGSETLTAFALFREQLVIFNRNSFYRMAIQNAYNIDQWEVLDTVTGLGCLDKKLVCVTPEGFCFANESGIYISDGRIPACLTNDPGKGLAITNLYQWIMLGNNYQYMSSLDHDFEIRLLATDIPPGSTYNRFSELFYNEMTDELMLSYRTVKEEFIPVKEETTDVIYLNYLIYSFKFNNWRIEVYPNRKGYPTMRQVKATDAIITELTIQNSKPDFYIPIGLNNDDNYCLLIQPNRLSSGDFDQILENAPISTLLLTHELGDGIDDNILHSSYLEAVPTNVHRVSPIYNSTNKNITFEYSLRSITNRIQSNIFIDAIEPCISSKTGQGIGSIALANQSAYTVLQTPNDSLDSSDKVVSDESIKVWFPLATKFRRAIFRLSSNVTAKVKSIVMTTMTMKRRQE